MTQGMDNYYIIVTMVIIVMTTEVRSKYIPLPIIAGDGPTVNMEMSLMNQSEDDDHSGGQEETRGSRLCCVM